MNKSRVKIVRFAAILFGGIGFAWAVIAYFISTWHLQNAPLEQNVSTGEIYPFFIRGVTIYLTKSALIIEKYLFGSMFLFVGLSLICFNWVDRQRSLLEKLGLQKSKE